MALAITLYQRKWQGDIFFFVFSIYVIINFVTTKSRALSGTPYQLLDICHASLFEKMMIYMKIATK